MCVMFVQLLRLYNKKFKKMSAEWQFMSVVKLTTSYTLLLA